MIEHSVSPASAIVYIMFWLSNNCKHLFRKEALYARFWILELKLLNQLLSLAFVSKVTFVV